MAVNVLVMLMTDYAHGCLCTQLVYAYGAGKMFVRRNGAQPLIMLLERSSRALNLLQSLNVSLAAPIGSSSEPSRCVCTKSVWHWYGFTTNPFLQPTARPG